MLIVAGVVLTAPLAAQQPPPVPPVVPATSPTRSDSAAQDSTRRRVDPLVRVLPFRQDTLRLRRPVFLGQFTPFNPLRNDPDALARSIAESFRVRVQQRDEQRWQQGIARSLTVPFAMDTVRVAVADTAPRPGALVPVRPDSAALRPGGLSEIVDGVADYGINVTSRLESKFQRTRNERCTAAQLTIVGNNCFGSFQPSFDFQFGVLSGGVVADRVHVNVDYDSQREFDASNNISVFYQGKTDEMLQRLEVGNVTLQTPGSRFITSGIPSGNYGVQLTGQLGPMRFTGIAANQKGNVSRDNIFTVGDRTLQPVDRTIDDIQIESRRFFFTVDPRQFAGYPNIDVLNRQQMQQLATALPDSIRPRRLYVYRQLIGAQNQNPRGPQFTVRGAQNPSRQIYQLLRENVDYYVDPSQLWIALVAPLNQNSERLAIAYEVTVNGVTGRNVSTGGTPDLEFTEAPQFAGAPAEQSRILSPRDQVVLPARRRGCAVADHQREARDWPERRPGKAGRSIARRDVPAGVWSLTGHQPESVRRRKSRLAPTERSQLQCIWWRRQPEIDSRLLHRVSVGAAVCARGPGTT
jgi:hypothetical protein